MIYHQQMSDFQTKVHERYCHMFYGRNRSLHACIFKIFEYLSLVEGILFFSLFHNAAPVRKTELLEEGNPDPLYKFLT